jgi:hypothetical protein
MAETATSAPAKPTCPTCGATLHRQDLSLCAYCGAPLSIGAAKPKADDETIRRLKRLRDNPGFAAAMAWTPRDLAADERASRIGRVGVALAVAGAIAFLAALRGDAARWQRPVLAVAVGGAAGAAGCWLAGAAIRKRANARPMFKRPAYVVDRRSETAERGGRGVTLYYFTLRFEDGSEGEFRWPGRGTANEPMPSGVTGIAYTRGNELVEYRRL